MTLKNLKGKSMTNNDGLNSRKFTSIVFQTLKHFQKIFAMLVEEMKSKLVMLIQAENEMLELILVNTVSHQCALSSLKRRAKYVFFTAHAWTSSHPHKSFPLKYPHLEMILLLHSSAQIIQITGNILLGAIFGTNTIILH